MEIKPYGSWSSPIHASQVVAGSIGLGQIKADGNNLYWTETRPENKGRNILVKWNEESGLQEILPTNREWNVRTRVHEYGGGAFTVHHGVCFFSNFQDQKLYQFIEGTSPQPFSPEGNWRFADGFIDRKRNRFYCVGELHSPGQGEPENLVVSLNPEKSGEPKRVLEGNDFYSSPCLSPDGDQLAWICWNHPNMPWDATELWVGDLNEEGEIIHSQPIAGGKDESVLQPKWSPDGQLYFVSDRTGWWNLYCWDGRSSKPIKEMRAEFTFPHWVFGESTYAFTSKGNIYCAYTQDGQWNLALFEPKDHLFTTIQIPYTELSNLQCMGENLYLKGGSPTEADCVVEWNPSTQKIRTLRQADSINIAKTYLSVPQNIRMSSSQGHYIHGFYYPPKNPGFQAIPGEKPPLIVKTHGGPTAAASSSLNRTYQFWTSRGFAVLDVNYGGSTGFGRKNREALQGKWGLTDVQDCVELSDFLVRKGLADPTRLIIRGGSAGGYTTLCALTFTNHFQVGASLYGICDLEALARDTHKFEARYLESLVGLYPDQKEIYRERSPIHYTDQLSCPVILFQGLEDLIVPPNQAEMMVEALQKKGIKVKYVAFEREQHGFRIPENIQKVLEEELRFYAEIFDIRLANL